MRYLYLRFFLTFWGALILVGASSFYVTQWFADELREAELQRQDQLAEEAKAALEADGSDGLRDWLRGKLPSESERGNLLFIIDETDTELLLRPLPDYLRARFGRGQFPQQPPQDIRGQPLRRNVGLSRLLGPAGERYLLLFSPRRQPMGAFGALTQTPLLAGMLALLVSAALSYLLARYLSRPVQVLRNATHSIASGDLSVRVAGLMGGRRDELGTLAIDFDAMAVRLRALLDSHQTLLRDVSHELRSPLARLQIALGLARRPNAQLERELDRIEQEAQRLDDLIGEILSLCRLDDPVRQLQLEDVQLYELLDSLCKDARVESEPHQVSVTLDCRESLQLRGDRELLYRALENVLRNAVRFSPDGGQIGVSASARASGIEIAIQDRGPGVPDEALQRIFEPFYRVADARDSDSGGHGIGLAITARVVRLHNGTVTASNVAGGGLRVVIRLP